MITAREPVCALYDALQARKYAEGEHGLRAEYVAQDGQRTLCFPHLPGCTARAQWTSLHREALACAWCQRQFRYVREPGEFWEEVSITAQEREAVEQRILTTFCDDEVYMQWRYRKGQWYELRLFVRRGVQGQPVSGVQIFSRATLGDGAAVTAALTELDAALSGERRPQEHAR